MNNLSYFTLFIFLSIFFSSCSENSSEDSLVQNVEGEDSNNDFNEIPEENLPSGSYSIALTGFSEIGPFFMGSKVILNAVDASTLLNVGEPLETFTASNLGDYAFNGTLNSAYASISVEGNYFNYSTYDSTSLFKLNAFSKVSNRSQLNINILTHLEYNRIRYLILEQGASFDEAKKKSEREIIAAFHMFKDTTLFESLSLKSTSIGTQNLIAITSILLGERSQSDFEKILNSILEDIQVDGKWDNDSLKAMLADEANIMMINYFLTSIGSRLNVDIVIFESAVMEFWANVYGLGSCTDSLEGVIKQNTNKLSNNYENYYKCSNKSWETVSDVVLKSLELEKDFGKCLDNNEGIIKEDSQSESFICKKNFWIKASEGDIINKKVSESKGICDTSKNTQVESLNNEYFTCVGNSWKKLDKKPLDYTLGRKMNKRLGRGINLGNSWDSQGNGSSGDCGWNNCIEDDFFGIIKSAGFNSVRIPVRWNADALRDEPYTINSGRLLGVKDDVSKAINQGLAVIINIHHYEEMLKAAANYKKSPDGYKKEKNRMVSIWDQVSREFNSFPDSLLVFEIFNEPRDMDIARLNEFMLESYNVIRKNAPNKTIMFESLGYSKFAQIVKLDMPNDGNVIASGHYYEPYTISHQGHGYDCKNSLSGWVPSTVTKHFMEYVNDIAIKFPDINGGFIPLNMGEFGVSGQHGSSCASDGLSDSYRAIWTDAVISEAEKYGMSWHYWGFVGVGGFEAYDKWAKKWYNELYDVFSKYINSK